MVSSFSLLNKYYCGFPKEIKTQRKLDLPNRKVQLKRQLIVASHESLLSRRVSLVSISTVIGFGFNALPPIKAEENDRKDKNEEGDGGVLGAMKSIFDPNEKTKSGKVLPKGYLKAAREVVRTLRESLEEDTKDVAKFRRNADAAKESIREYLSGWRGQQTVVAEESYAALERAIRSLANFYAKAGPFASLSDEVKTRILNDLNTAEAFL
uniref:Photosystem II D1 processing protein PSB27-H2, chloroplastic n=1 Tax=Ananas comosus var. bracteatus TaxID=296719 RepID=A0A6V7QX96_ANACO